MTEFFFITGLPRTRTGWLANLLTVCGSVCFHDGLRGCASVEALRDKLCAAAHAEGVSYVGNADSGLTVFGAELARVFPVSRAVVVQRDWMEAAEDFHRFFSRQPYRGVPCGSREEVLRTFNWLREQQDNFVRAWPQDRLMLVEARALDEREVCRQVFEYCAPGVPWSPVRWSILDHLQVNPASWKIDAGGDAAGALLREVVR